ncbi:MAG: hypothetical protein C5B51_26380 [Terriglobia bacterium]|nr:MAG: hypothetical protein C5B51_26380 [Terriglobia bacterium]
MRDTESGTAFEQEHERLARFLVGTQQRLNIWTNDVHRQSWKKARTMLKPDQLLDACEFALTLIAHLSTDEFAAGGDRPARERLLRAIQSATDGTFDHYARQRECRHAVIESLRDRS